MLEALQGQPPSDLAATLRGLLVAANGGRGHHAPSGRHAGVGGIIAASVFGIFVIPLFYITAESLRQRTRRKGTK